MTPSDRARRRFIARSSVAALGPPTGLLFAPTANAAVSAEAVDALRRGGVVAAFRHAQAPGTFDPPGFKLGDCSTQRNLGDAGRVQAKQLGDWFRAQKLAPRRVRSSPWCRCVDTARLAFGTGTPSAMAVEAWDALGSTLDGASVPERQVQAMRRALAELPGTGFEVWVSHQSTLGQLVGESTSSGEGLLLRPQADGRVQVIARFQPA
jgi:phosphohistidine phosphatase SixA